MRPVIPTDGTSTPVCIFCLASILCLMYNVNTNNHTKCNDLRVVRNHFMAEEIGDTVIQLLENGKRVTTGNIADLLERKSHTLHGEKADNIREILIFIRKKSVL